MRVWHAICWTAVGIFVGLALAQGNLRLAKQYNQEGQEAFVEASQMYFEAAQWYMEAAELTDNAIDVCLGRVGV